MPKKRKLEPKSTPGSSSPAAIPSPGPDPEQEDPYNSVEEQEAPQNPIQEDEDPQTLDSETNGSSSGDPSAAEADVGFGDEENDPVSIQKLLEPFPKDQLVELLRDAAVEHPDVLAKIHHIADADPSQRKIFVHGLGWETNADSLIAAFNEFGEIEDCKAVIDKISGRSKGYGFILFKHRSGARRALKEPQKKIGNRMAACQLASTGPPTASAPPPALPVSEYTQRKIYVSNVGADLDPQKLLQFFSKFGEIEDGPLGLDKATGKPKGFCLFVYRTVESARKALEEPHKNFEGTVLHCQKAIDGPKPGKPGYSVGGSHHFGFGGGYGGQFSRNGNAPGFPSAGGGGHLMAPPATGLGFNQVNPQTALAAAGLSPALAQALTSFLATQGTGVGGLTSLLGALGSAGMVNQGVASSIGSSAHGMQGGYGSQGAYVPQASMQGGYGNAAIGQGGAGRNQPGAGHMGAPYIGH